MHAIQGESLIGQRSVPGAGAVFQGLDAASGEALQPVFASASAQDLEQACALAHAAFDAYRDTSLEVRAGFLETIAEQILALGDALIERAMRESGLPRARLEGERGRTVGQLRLFANVVREGSWLQARIDPAMPQRTPLPRADLRQRHIALGPVAVFGASNFPLAFSVAGGDTASALAAGCPVVVKAHGAHPGTSELVGRAIQAAVAQCGLPEGVFSLLFDAGIEIGAQLVADARIKAVGFTGSRGGGMALVKIASARREPIPVYAEMSAINPVYLLPHALEARASALGKAFVGSLTLGAGQFCTNPGLLLAIDSPALDGFIVSVTQALQEVSPAAMLTTGIGHAYAQGVQRLDAHPQVVTLARGAAADTGRCPAALFGTDADAFLADEALQAEVFGASSLLVRCKDIAQLRALSEQLEGQLTATLHMDDGDSELAGALLPVLERKAGRILVNDWPTGVEVCHAMVHGGPFPATSDSRSTSVGTLAIDRFLRPVCYQDLPAALLPAAVAHGNPLGLWRRVDGALGHD
ncbi:aldehyde dehydrogenase (NADP(+)) [Xanthomonas cucurbitae]|uniref:Aldehyde dehydrogenase (NADP(+)) n=1 Tax=Xanthomonas cucurbitae TaxID=56453 RepID=A0ABY7YAG5_9XANT|nr:aldehyde dehydrogenase (NADP(+)) [Xanthomonas cucurbitae]WDM66934.1 aldehyde dehydrogenase (NADP(+)) [Xanthomonas cucurbitae]WDM70810.1 aldehyde dehydrogenase (NADP(+)) [Xanthomonas cucurbitae]